MQDDGTPFRPLAVQDMGEPGDIEAAGEGVAGKIPRNESDAVAEAEGGNCLFGKGAGGGEVVDGGIQLRIGLAELNRIGTGTTAEIEEAPLVPQIDWEIGPRSGAPLCTASSRRDQPAMR